ncbi:hypothetical protein BGZ47_009057 [Haplosporangium gracile]|nr:hypothetical protein BGZ47_009057 [Haplosporangium gracile]
MNTREYLNEAGSQRTFESQSRSLSTAPGSSSTLPETVLSAQRRPPQHLLDQRRHTVDYSAWNAQGAFDQFLCVDQIATHRAAAGSDLSNKHDSMASAWSSHSSESSFTSLSDKQEIDLASTNLIGNKQRSSSRLHPHAFSQQQHPANGVTSSMIDSFGRRASMSQLSFYGGVWEQPDQALLHKHSSSLQVGYDILSFPVPASNVKGQAEEDSARNTDWDKELPGSGSLATIHDDLSFLTESGSDHNLTLPTFSQRQHQQLPSSLASSRRNSRILPNPIQPPAISHARKQSMDELTFKEQDQSQDKSTHPFSASTSSATFSDVSIPEDDSLTASSTMSSFSSTSNQSNNIQHGGFVPGYDPWAEKIDKLDTNAASTGLDIQSQRRNSESILHDLSASNLDYLTMTSICQQPGSLHAPPWSSIPPHLSGRSVSPINSGPSGGHTMAGSFTGSRTPGMCSGSVSYEPHPLSSVESHESGVAKADTRAPGHHLNSTQPALHPHFETAIPSESGSNPQLNDGATMEMCGLCGVQLAIVPLGSCGHRVCNVCHRHEKHRSFRLFQNASPPCPFCIHGVTPAQQSLSLGKPSMSGTDGNKQNRHYSFPHMPQQTYSGQQGPQQAHQQRPQRQKQTFVPRAPYDNTNSDDMGDGCPLNRQYHQTFPIYGAAHTTALFRTSSLQFDNAPTITSSNSSISGPTANPGNYASATRPTDHFIQNVGNAAYQKPPPGFFSLQASTHGGQNALKQQHLHKQGLNQYAPNFQPAGISMTQQYHDSGNMAAMGRPGMISPPTGAWRETGSGIADYTAQEYAYQQQPPMPPQYLQQRRGSQQHTLLPPAIGNAPQGYQFYGHAMNNLANPGGAPNAPSVALSFPILPDLPSAVPPTRPRTEAIQWAVVRVTNIPWDVSLQDMLGFFAGFPYPPEHLLAQNVHILMDRTSGKTFNSAFIELALTTRQAGLVAQARNQRVLKGRQVSVELSSQDELLRSVFPKWTGDFVNGEPLIPGERASIKSADGEGDKDGQNVAPWHLDSAKQAQSTPPFVTRDEINALLVICRNYKACITTSCLTISYSYVHLAQLHFSRKCAERPFENILSILAKYPWHQAHRVLPLHRDHIFELLKLSIESLRMHLSKEYNTIHPTLLTRMVRCAVLTSAFTERQKNMVLVVAGVTCPEDIVGWMAPPAPVEPALTHLDSLDELSIATEDAENDSATPSDSDASLAKDEESTEVKSIEEAIECLAISESPISSGAMASGDVLTERPKAAASTGCVSSAVEHKENKPSLPVTTWAAVVVPSAKAAGPTESTSNEGTPTATPAPPSSNTSLKSGGCDMTLTPSYAAAVVQTAGSDAIPKASAQAFQNPCGNLALGSNESGSPSSPTSLGSLVHSSSNAWKSLGSHYRHNSGRSLSISSISSFASPDTRLVPVNTIPYTFPSLTLADAAESTVLPFRSAFLKSTSESFGGDGSEIETHSTTALITSGRHHRGGSLPKLAIPRGVSETTSFSTTASSVFSLATPFNISSVSASPPVTGEKSTSESILHAIKTITQSTPRLTKSGSANQMPISASSTLLSGIASAAGQSSGSIGSLGLGHKQQRREEGETL